jgi:hypothetical protein
MKTDNKDSNQYKGRPSKSFMLVAKPRRSFDTKFKIRGNESISPSASKSNRVSLIVENINESGLYADEQRVLCPRSSTARLLAHAIMYPANLISIEEKNAVTPVSPSESPLTYSKIDSSFHTLDQEDITLLSLPSHSRDRADISMRSASLDSSILASLGRATMSSRPVSQVLLPFLPEEDCRDDRANGCPITPTPSVFDLTSPRLPQHSQSRSSSDWISLPSVTTNMSEHLLLPIF